MAEIVKRLPPKFSTLRALFVRSGNECAYPGCDHVLVNLKGQWVGEVCHMASASQGGERFDSSMTNEERRDGKNLLLMCHEHHVETNEVQAFPISRLRQIKEDHEAKSGSVHLSDESLKEAVDKIVAASIEDNTDRVILSLPQTLSAFETTAGIESEDEAERASTLELLASVFESLRFVPVDSRAVFAILVDRTTPGERVSIPVHELEFATGLGPGALAPHFEILERYDLVSLEEMFPDDRPAFFEVQADDIGRTGWYFWDDFRKYCHQCGFEPKEVINELRFNLLD